VITPSLARAHKDIRTIPLVTCATITRSSTLREVKFQVSNHLQIPILDIVRPSEECNCSFARQIDERALRNEAHPSNPVENLANPLLKFIVVHGQNRVQVSPTPSRRGQKSGYKIHCSTLKSEITEPFFLSFASL
jgi:hypothetical protein